jgi:hypothetical protein
VHGCKPLDYFLRNDDCIPRKEAPTGTINMSTKHSFHAVPPLSSAKPHLVNRGKQYSMSGGMSVQTKIVIVTTLVFFAILHAIGFTLMKSESDRLTVEPAHMYGAD